MLSKMALGAIWGYQRYLSPHKGFRCAYSVHHGGTGCSGFAKSAIRDHGVWRAIPAIRKRLQDCRMAYAEIRAQCGCRTEQQPLDEDERQELERRRKTDKRNCNACDCCSGAGSCLPLGSGLGSGLGTGGARAGASKGCDINPCDGDIGFGGCDCASCDCGGCSCG